MAEMVQCARYYAIIVLIALTTTPSSIRGDTSASARTFTLIDSASGLSVANVAESSWSKTACAMKCLRTSGCSTFCKSASSTACYLQSSAASAIVQPLGNTSDVTCYETCDPNKCPSSLGYSLIECRCLKLYHDSVAYLLAKYLCAVDQGHLYYYKNLEVDEPAIVHVLQTSETNSGQYWVGADDLQDEGQFLWTDGSALASDDPVWVDGEPSGGSEEGCVEILTDPAEPATRLRRLNDFPCSITQDFICQIDL